ncbi:MAG TPA: hypothetical protein VGM87_24755 [Roseomonas sp.]
MSETQVTPRALLPLFLISLAAVALETGLTRFFAVASWSEYGYWVISIAMTGFAVSGVVMVLGRDALLQRAAWLLPALPLALMATGAAGWVGVTLNPFNPLELQNGVTWHDQAWNILLYYAALFPFFFLTGFAVSLYFVRYARAIGRVYGWDLLGAGAGAVATIGLLHWLHPFHLVPALLPVLAVAALLTPAARPALLRVATLAVLLASEALVILVAAPRVSEYKPVSVALNVPDSRVLAEVLSPRGVYQLLENFTERLDTDISNNLGLLGLPPPGRSYGLYRDGVRIGALPMERLAAPYARATLAAGPYALLDHPRVLLIGASGGYRVAEALALDASSVVVQEPEPMLRDILVHGLGPVPPLPHDPRVTLSDTHPLRAPGDRFDLIDYAGDILDAEDQSRHLYAAEAIADQLARLAPGGLLSLPVNIRELPVYAIRVLASVRQALRIAGTADPAAHVVVLRSAWNLRVLVSPAPWTAERVAALHGFAEERSFDISFAPHLDEVAPDRTVWNELPPVALESETQAAGDDAIAEEAPGVLAGTPARDAFDRSPVTEDRPWLAPLVRLSALPLALARVEVLPQAEIGTLVNVAVLAQAAVLALLVALLPALRRRGIGAPAGLVLRALPYFAALGLGFLMIEIALIEQAAFLLEDRATGFALVLTAMLVFSGCGSMLAGRFEARPRRALLIAGAVILVWCAAALFGLRGLVGATLDWPWLARAALVLAITAPAGVALGLPFPLGLERFARRAPRLLPWAWALNGAFSVVSTPLANLLARTEGLSALLVAALLCYVTAMLVFPRNEA